MVIVTYQGRRLKLWWSLAMVFSSMLIFVCASILYSNHVGYKADRHAEQLNAQARMEIHSFCELIVSLDERNHKAARTDPDSLRFAREIQKIRSSLRCQ